MTISTLPRVGADRMNGVYLCRDRSIRSRLVATPLRPGGGTLAEGSARGILPVCVLGDGGSGCGVGGGRCADDAAGTREGLGFVCGAGADVAHVVCYLGRSLVGSRGARKLRRTIQEDAIGEGGALLGGRAAEVAGRMTVGRLVICSRRQVWFRVFFYYLPRK